jgi:hypothetical protein
MESPQARLDAIVDLDARHDDLIRQLDQLDQQVEQVLKQWLGARDSSEPDSAEVSA